MPIALHLCGADDVLLLDAQNAPETEARGASGALQRRHERYLRLSREGAGRMFRVATGDAPAVGSIAWWHARWHDQDVLEAGWAILPAHQGHGCATEALRLLLRDAADHGDRPLLLARPATDDAATNAVCARAGLSFRGAEHDAHPAGTPVRANVWTFDLAALRRARALGYDGEGVARG